MMSACLPACLPACQLGSPVFFPATLTCLLPAITEKGGGESQTLMFPNRSSTRRGDLSPKHGPRSWLHSSPAGSPTFTFMSVCCCCGQGKLSGQRLRLSVQLIATRLHCSLSAGVNVLMFDSWNHKQIVSFPSHCSSQHGCVCVCGCLISLVSRRLAGYYVTYECKV